MSEEANNNVFIMTDNDQMHSYFNRVDYALKHMIGMASSTSESNDDVNQMIEKIRNTYAALRMSFFYNGILQNRANRQLMIDKNLSGLPLLKEIIYISSDLNNIDQHLVKSRPAETIKRDILNEVTSFGVLNKELQAELAWNEYLNFIANNELFLDFEPAVLRDISIAGKDMISVAWGVYDSKQSRPTINFMIIDHSYDNQIPEDVKNAVINHINNQERSNRTLLSTLKDLDTKYEFLHPMMMRRFNIGPVYMSDVTNHNAMLEEALNLSPSKEEDWIFTTSVQSIQSQGQATRKSGLFSSRIIQIYDIENHSHSDPDTFGESSVARMMILPYGVFQGLNEIPDNPLNNFKKYVVNDGEMIFL